MKGKSLNKRLSSTKIRKQQHLLEVTVRADKARAMRARAVVSFFCKSILWLMFLGGAYFGGRELLQRFVWENPDYFLTDIRVSNCELLQRDQILVAASIREGMNVFEVDTKAARAALDALPQVERAEIQRILPNRVDITITERRPIAWVTQSATENPTITNTSAWLIDARGVVVKPRQIIEQYHHLPHISGVAVANFAPGQRVKTVEMESALKLIQINAENTRWQVRHIDLGKQWCLIVTDQGNSRITFGLDAIDDQLSRLFRYLERAEAEQREIDTLNLMVVKYTPVTFRVTGNGDEANADTPVEAAEPAAARVGQGTPKPEVPVARATPVTLTPRSSKSKTEIKSNSRSGRSTPANIRKPFRQN